MWGSRLSVESYAYLFVNLMTWLSSYLLFLFKVNLPIGFIFNFMSVK